MPGKEMTHNTGHKLLQCKYHHPITYPFVDRIMHDIRWKMALLLGVECTIKVSTLVW